MSKPGFVHLHLHTQYSLLDGAIRLHELFPRLRELGQDAVAITDHGVMFGVVDFYRRAHEGDKEKDKARIKPIVGCEIYVAPGDMRDKTQRGAGHLVLLARDLEGYRNLVQLVSRAWLEGYFYSPRVDRRLLGERSAGLIGLSACTGGDVARAICEQGEAEGERVACEYRALFHPDSYFLEVQQTGYPEQQAVNEALRRISGRTGIPLVATNDAHYLYKEDAAAHDILMRIQEGKTIRDQVNLRHSEFALYLRSADEMLEALPGYEDAVAMSVEIAARCNVELPLDPKKPMLPDYETPTGELPEGYLHRLSLEGLERRFEQMKREGRAFERATYIGRLDYELRTIRDKGYSGYYLIVQDFIRYARENGIPVGPGRGSGAGSLVAYALRITDLDPLRFGLIFERFLNPMRPTTPDFDIDFCKERRDEVIAYVTKKYGDDRVGQIATFHQIKSRSAVKDVGRVLELPFAERDRLSKLIPPPTQAGDPGSIEDALGREPRLRAEYERSPEVRRLLDFAARLEGLHRHAGQHAAGVVIAGKPLWEIVPVFRSKDGTLVSQYDMNSVDHVGLVKFDFLGLKNLTAIDRAVKMIRRRPGREGFDIDRVPLDDHEVFEMLTGGQTLGVFQLESRGFRELVRRLKPDRIEDIVAAVAIFRPGPLDNKADEQYIRRKHGLEPIACAHGTIAEVCAETYGVVLYQEQVMKIAQEMAGYSLGEADRLRKAMGKKKKEEMDANRVRFIEGAEERGVPRGVAEGIFEDLAKFAGYAFNKSHSAAYAIVAYQTAYLKRRFPVEFLAALLTCDRDDTDRVVRYISEARALGLEVLGPEINESEADFTVVEGRGPGTGSAAAGAPDGPPADDVPRRIRFGLSAVKGVGGAALDAILEARAQGPFQDLFDFCGRVDPRAVNRGVLESLVAGGAFDAVGRRAGVSRATTFASIDRALEFGRARQRDRQIGQQGLFDLFLQPGSDGASAVDAGVPAAYVDGGGPGDEAAMLRAERQAIGAYLSGHPLHRYAEDLRRYGGLAAAEVVEQRVGTTATVGGLVENLVERLNKKTGRRTAVFMLEDLTGAVEVFVPPQALERAEAVLRSGQPVLCTGRTETASFREAGRGDESDDETTRFVLTEAATIESVRLDRTRAVHLRLDAPRVDAPVLERLARLVDANRGSCAVFLHVRVPHRGESVIALPDRFRVAPTDQFVLGVARDFGPGAVALA